jgi:uncharacterized protein YjbJ (UPF0337 family)
MSDSGRDRMEGKYDEMKGRTKEAAGDLTGDKDKKFEGQRDQVMGKAKQGLADFEDKADKAMDDFADGDKR